MVQHLKICRNIIGISSVKNVERIKIAFHGTYTATDAPVFIYNGNIILKRYSSYRADIYAFAASHTDIRVCFADKIDGHEFIPWNLTSPDCPHIPAGAAAAVAIVFYLVCGIINKMNQACLRRITNYLSCLFPGNLSAKPLGDQICRHFIKLKANFKRMLTGPFHEACLNPA